ncbi:MAG: formyltetrahydrofolate deformylase [Candidatus Marinimicrobia bacterium]|nr:formyltetrahydrofolate deformylase [Candidatus Neomarinimicrobiota bacterium]MCF7851297.1 formyltetrahydrofolate deformylase [Candidatus Neomarinimicrobiota bacterium]MCF7904765.1 formyltetrahydrofolate deformylase [Candidatus Neomarinimicrobiota bacterium]
MSDKKLTAVLLLTCDDQKGLVSTISNFISEHNGNILDLNEHVDRDEKLFTIRVSWDMKDFAFTREELRSKFRPIAESIGANWLINFKEQKRRVAIFVSKYDHVLLEILWRHKMGEYPIEIPLIISNHEHLRELADHYGIPFHIFPVTPETKAEQEKRELELLEEHDIDTVVLARYMQILSPDFVSKFPYRIINIHHSFLPAFIGGNPYKQAYERGVKLIGATSHYVTADLDEGPIIAQDVTKISHKDSLKDLVRKGRDLERLVTARALQVHFERRVLVVGKKTIIFE